MKDECEGREIEEAVAIRPKSFRSWKERKKNIRKAKGVRKNVVEEEVRHQHYKEVLF